MASKDLLKTALFGSLLAITALTTIALYNPAHAVTEDEYGMDPDPYCSFHIKKNTIESGQKPTGIVTSTKNWDLEIYQDPENKSWTLLGKRHEKIDSKEFCILADGYTDYNQTKWYQEFFKLLRNK